MKVDISLKEMFVYVLRRWKLIVAFALVLSVAIGLDNYYKQAPHVRNETPDLNESFASEDENNKYVYGTVKLSMGIDLTNFTGTSPDVYYITIAKNDLYTKIYDRYLLISQGAKFTEMLKSVNPLNFSIEAKPENIRFESSTPGVFSIFVSGVTGADSDEVATAIYDYLVSYNGIIGESVAEHALTFIASSFTESTPAKEDTTPAEEETSSESVATDVSSPIINALVAFLAGLVVAALVAAVLYLVRLPIQVPDQVQQQLGIRYIGGIRKRKFLSLGDRLAGSLRIADDGEAISMIYANLKSFIGSHTKVLITGSIDEESVKKFVEKINLVNDMDDVIFFDGADINKSASGINALIESDAVVLVESIDQSRLKTIKEEKDRIDMSGKHIIGYVLY